MVSLTDYFIPDPIAEAGGIEKRRAEIAVKSVYILVPWGIIASIFVGWLFTSLWMGLAVGTGPMFIATAPLVLRQTGSMDAASLTILIPMFVIFTAYSAFTGGVLAPGASWLLLVPLMALIYRGAKMATIMLVLVLLTWGALFGGEQLGYIAPVDVTEERFIARRMIELLALGTTVFGFFLLKDNLQAWLIDNLRKKEAKTRAVFETAPDGILTIDLEGIIRSANDAAARIFGVPVDELLDSPIDDRVATLATDQLSSDTDRLTQFGANEEHRGLGADGEFPLEVAFGLLDANEDERVVLVLRDITERKEGERQLRTARDQALEASRAKSTFLANMSHELRTPLNAVIGYSEMLIEEISFAEKSPDQQGLEPDQLTADIQRIHSAGQHLLALINDILDLSKIEAGETTLHVESFDVSPLVDEITTTIYPLAKENDNDVRVFVDDDVTTMRSDVTKVRQILLNLLSNACKFTEDGYVRVDVEADEEADQIVFTVEDSGIGMTEEQIAEVFDAFRQADDSTTRQFGGTGLGLTITRHFCEMLGGGIDVESSPGEGTTITVCLACTLDADQTATEAAAQESTSADRPVQPPRHRTDDVLLVVDDDPSVRDLLQRMLEGEDFDVVTASNGEEGLELAQKIEPSAIILDVMMPTMDGWTMLSNLRDDSALRDIPVIMVTMLTQRQRGYALGAEHYLVKPVQRRELIDIVEHYRGAGGTPGRALIVEDDEPTRSLMRRVLSTQGWQVAQATNGREALDVVDDGNAPDLVLLDLMMPEMDGIGFLEEFRSQGKHSDVPVVIVTAKTLSPEEKQQLEEQVEKIVLKAGSEDKDLVSKIRSLVQQYGHSSRSESP